VNTHESSSTTNAIPMKYYRIDENPKQRSSESIWSLDRRQPLNRLAEVGARCTPDCTLNPSGSSTRFKLERQANNPKKAIQRKLSHRVDQNSTMHQEEVEEPVKSFPKHESQCGTVAAQVEVEGGNAFRG
jgi:hypothetical protein